MSASNTSTNQMSDGEETLFPNFSDIQTVLALVSANDNGMLFDNDYSANEPLEIPEGLFDSPRASRKLPEGLFTPADVQCLEHDACSICREPFGEEEGDCRMPVRLCCSGGHVFGEFCIRSWLDPTEPEPRRTCPMCREEIVAREDGLSEGPGSDSYTDYFDNLEVEWEDDSMGALPTTAPEGSGSVHHESSDADPVFPLEADRANVPQTFYGNVAASIRLPIPPLSNALCVSQQLRERLQSHRHFDEATGQWFFDGLPL